MSIRFDYGNMENCICKCNVNLLAVHNFLVIVPVAGFCSVQYYPTFEIFVVLEASFVGSKHNNSYKFYL